MKTNVTLGSSLLIAVCLAGCHNNEAPLKIEITEVTQDSIEAGEHPEISDRIQSRQDRAREMQSRMDFSRSE